VWDYEQVLIKEFDPARLEQTYREFLDLMKNKTGANTGHAALDFQRSTMSHWKEVGAAHITEVRRLFDRCRVLFEMLPPVSTQTLSPFFDIRTTHEQRELQATEELSKQALTLDYQKLEDVIHRSVNRTKKLKRLRQEDNSSVPEPPVPLNQMDLNKKPPAPAPN